MTAGGGPSGPATTRTLPLRSPWTSCDGRSTGTARARRRAATPASAGATGGGAIDDDATGGGVSVAAGGGVSGRGGRRCDRRHRGRACCPSDRVGRQVGREIGRPVGPLAPRRPVGACPPVVARVQLGWARAVGERPVERPGRGEQLGPVPDRSARARDPPARRPPVHRPAAVRGTDGPRQPEAVLGQVGEQVRDPRRAVRGAVGLEDEPTATPAPAGPAGQPLRVRRRPERPADVPGRRGLARQCARPSRRARDPLPGPGEVDVGHARQDRGGRPVGTRVRAEEPHVRAHPVQTHERLGHALLRDVPLRVDRERVPAEQVTDRAGLDPREVHPARGELLEHLEQGAGVVARQVHDEGRLVGAGRLRDRSRAGRRRRTG